MVTLSELKRKIRTDAAAYDKYAAAYNKLIQKERVLGHLVLNGRNGTVTVRNTPAGRAAGKRIVNAWNMVARRGKKLKAELTIYLKYQNRKTAARTRRTSTTKRRSSRVIRTRTRRR